MVAETVHISLLAVLIVVAIIAILIWIFKALRT